MLVGNDYVWPRVSHRIARRAIAAGGGRVVAETLVPFGVEDCSPLIDALRASRALAEEKMGAVTAGLRIPGLG